MHTTAVLINPGSGRGTRKGEALAEQLENTPHITVVRLHQFGELEAKMRELMAKNIERIFVSGGDGTVHAVQTILAESDYHEGKVSLGLLPHGTTNMTARDIGIQTRSVAAQCSVIKNPEQNTSVRRATLRISNAADGKIRHGMFLGTGAVAEAALYSQSTLHDRGLTGNAAPFAVLAKAIAKTTFYPADPSDENRFDRPFPIAINVDGSTLCNGTQMLAIFTTLSKLILGSRPFWGGANAPIRCTVLPYPMPRVLRWVLPILYGAEDRTMPKGALSTSGNAIAINSGSHYILDGEFFEGPSSGDLKVTTGPTFNYIVS